MREETHSYDVCVVGGGMAGLIAAITAARHGARVALVQDRPVLGGNASGEIRMHICGAHGPNNRETGLLEEILLENHYRNPQPNYSIWDGLLYGKAQYQKNLDLFLNCSIHACQMDGDRIATVTGWQLTTETRHTIQATLFVDASGDGILAPLSGAEFRIGREGRAEYGESIAPEKTDRKTMGMSCLFQAREFPGPQPFIPPDWAESFTRPEDLRGRGCHIRKTNFWWMEVGGEQDSIHDTERLREQLVRIAYGVWNYIKNHSPDKDEFANWALDWIGYLPGKRESRRYVGDHVLNQNDISSAGRFDDLVCYGGWSMDDHFPAGFYHPEHGTIFHPAPSPFGIPYRSLYSRNIANLFCVGRCHSASHVAMSATRVMATTSGMGQAVGAAAAIAIREGLTPREVGARRIRDLQTTLMEDDVYLPWHTRPIPELSQSAVLTASSGNPEPLRNGTDRPVGEQDNGWLAPCGAWVEYRLAGSVPIREARIVFDSDLNRKDKNLTNMSARNMRHYYALQQEPWAVPRTLIQAFRIEARATDGTWQTVFRETNNYQRLRRIPLSVTTDAIRLIPETTWGAEQAHLFAFDLR